MVGARVVSEPTYHLCAVETHKYNNNTHEPHVTCLKTCGIGGLITITGQRSSTQSTRLYIPIFFSQKLSTVYIVHDSTQLEFAWMQPPQNKNNPANIKS
jgi:hypothetical protein